MEILLKFHQWKMMDKFGWCVSTYLCILVIFVDQQKSRALGKTLIDDIEELRLQGPALINRSDLLYVQEDITRPGMILGLMSMIIVEFSMLDITATIEVFLNLGSHLEFDQLSNSKPKSFYQFNNTILIADNGLKCVHAVNRSDLTVTTHSGICSISPKLGQGYGIDGAFSHATYSSPTYMLGETPTSVLLLDIGSIRKLDLISHRISTVFHGPKSSCNGLSIFQSLISLICGEELIVLRPDFSIKQKVNLYYLKRLKYPSNMKDVKLVLETNLESELCKHRIDEDRWWEIPSTEPYKINSHGPIPPVFRPLLPGSPMCTIWQKYKFHNVVWISQRFAVALLSKTETFPSTLAFIDTHDQKMKSLCRYDSLQSFCQSSNSTAKGYSFIAKINSTLMVIPKIDSITHTPSIISAALQSKCDVLGSPTATAIDENAMCPKIADLGDSCLNHTCVLDRTTLKIQWMDNKQVNNQIKAPSISILEPISGHNQLHNSDFTNNSFNRTKMITEPPSASQPTAIALYITLPIAILGIIIAASILVRKCRQARSTEKHRTQELEANHHSIQIQHIEMPDSSNENCLQESQVIECTRVEIDDYSLINDELYYTISDCDLEFTCDNSCENCTQSIPSEECCQSSGVTGEDDIVYVDNPTCVDLGQNHPNHDCVV